MWPLPRRNKCSILFERMQHHQGLLSHLFDLCHLRECRKFHHCCTYNWTSFSLYSFHHPQLKHTTEFKYNTNTSHTVIQHLHTTCILPPRHRPSIHRLHTHHLVRFKLICNSRHIQKVFQPNYRFPAHCLPFLLLPPPSSSYLFFLLATDRLNWLFCEFDDQFICVITERINSLL